MCVAAVELSREDIGKTLETVTREGWHKIAGTNNSISQASRIDSNWIELSRGERYNGTSQKGKLLPTEQRTRRLRLRRRWWWWCWLLQRTEMKVKRTSTMYKLYDTIYSNGTFFWCCCWFSFWLLFPFKRFFSCNFVSKQNQLKQFHTYTHRWTVFNWRDFEMLMI